MIVFIILYFTINIAISIKLNQLVIKSNGGTLYRIQTVLIGLIFGTFILLYVQLER